MRQKNVYFADFDCLCICYLGYMAPERLKLNAEALWSGSTCSAFLKSSTGICVEVISAPPEKMKNEE